MAGFGKAILISIMAVAAILVLFNMAFLFPWYMEIIETTFEVTQMIATDNYLTFENYTEVYETLKNKPIFCEMRDSVKIEAFHADGRKSAIEAANPPGYDVNYYYDKEIDEKPYVQMGNLVTVYISATYPFRMEILGRSIVATEIPVTFSMTTSTTRHYKDLPYDYGISGDYFYDYDD